VKECPAPYVVNYDVAKSLNVQMTLVNAEGEVIVDASNALEGSVNGELDVEGNYSSISVVFNLDNTSPSCAEWEITAFNLTVVGVKNFAVIMGGASTGNIQVHCL